MYDYKITALEYATKKGFSNSLVFSGYYGDGETTDLTYTILAIEGPDGVVLVDTGYDDNAENKKIEEGIGISGYQNPVKVLKKIGIEPEDVKHVILTHAHWDHMGGVGLFPNAVFYLQEEELAGWIKTLCLPKEYNTLKVSMSYSSVRELISLIEENRLVLLKGDVDDLFPGIHIREAKMGHSISSNVIIVSCKDARYVIAGDCAYVKDNIIGGRKDYVSMPNGFGIGSCYNAIQSMQDILRYAEGKIENVIVGHDPDLWEQYDSEITADGLHIAYVTKGQVPDERIGV